MSAKSVFILLLFAVGLGGYVAWDLWSQQQSEKKQEELSAIWKGDPQSIQQIQIKSASSEIRLKRSEPGWTVNGQLGDTKAVEEFLEGIAVEKQESLALEGESIDFAEFGLAPELGSIELSGEGTNSIFKVGTRKNIEGKNYLQVDSEKRVRLVAGTWIPKIEKKEFDFRDKRLFLGNLKSITEVVFDKGKSRFQFQLRSGVWTTAQEPSWKLDQNKVREILTQLQTNAVSEFLSEGPLTSAQKLAFQWDKPVFELSFVGTDFKVKAMRSKENVHAWFLQPGNRLVRVSPDFARTFSFESLQDFRDKRIEIPQQRDQLTKAQIKWESETQQLVDEKLTEVLRKLSSLQAQEIQEGQLSVVKGELQFFSSTGPVWRMKVGSKANSANIKTEQGHWWVSVEGTQELLLLTDEDLKSLGFEIPEKQSEKK